LAAGCRALAQQQQLGVGGPQRRGEEEALPADAAAVEQPGALGLRLHALGDHLEAQGSTEVHQAEDVRGHLAVAGDRGDEGAVDLEDRP
jgi:hypothetical protein